MRGDNLGSPVLSTYAVGGGATRQRRGGPDKPLGGSLALPAIAILGTVSAVAIVTFSFEGDPAGVANRQAGSSNQASREYPDEPVAGPSIDFAEITLAAENLNDTEPSSPKAAPPAGSAPQELPYLGVLQAKPIAPAPRPAPEVRPARAERPAGLVAHPEPRAEDATGPPVAGCVTDCPASGELQTAAELASATPELQPGLGEAAIPEQADAAVGQHDLPGEASFAEPVAAPLADVSQDHPGVLADASPPVLDEPPAELIAATAAPAIDETLVAGPAPAEVESPAAEPPANRDQVALNLAQSDAPADARSGTSDTGPAATIPQHLARIGERYSAPPPPAPSAEQAAIEQPAALAVQLGESHSARALGVVEATGSTVIVQEDELVAIRLGDLVSLFEDRFDHPLYVWMKSSAAASKFVTAETLAAAGISTHYDPERKQIVFSTAGE